MFSNLMVSGSFILKDFSVMLYFYFSNMLEVGVPGFTQTPQLLVYNCKCYIASISLMLYSLPVMRKVFVLWQCGHSLAYCTVG